MIAKPEHGSRAQSLLHFLVDRAMVLITVCILAAAIKMEGTAELLDLATSVVPAQLGLTQGQHVIVKA